MAPPRPGERIGDLYTLEDEIGRGGMAVVFAAKDHRHGRRVAIKFLGQEFTGPLGPDRFDREIQLAANLNHPHIVPVHDSGAHDGRLYYVMPYVEGTTLKTALEEEGPFSLEDARTVLRDVGEALAYAHGRGVVHRDIKPSNIMLTAGHAVVTDFGIAKALDEANVGLTSSGAVLGTPGYMAPEQATGESEIGPGADTYGLACVAYEMLCGEPPFKAASAHVRLARQLAGDPPSVSTIRTDLPAGAASVIRRAMALSPADRFATVTEFVEALDLRSPVPRPAWRSRLAAAWRGWRERSLSPVRTMAALAIVVAAVVAAVNAVRLISAPPPADWPAGRPPSVVILPMGTVGATEAARELAAVVAEDVTAELRLWEGIRVVPRVSLSGVLFDRGIADGTATRLDDAIGVARDLGVAALLTVSAEVRGDSARVQATLFDAGERLFTKAPRPVGRTVDAVAGAGASAALAEPIIREILGLTDQPFASLADQRRRSRNPEALIRAEEGRAHLERWELADAERSFRTAIDLDSTFAFAHHRLAQTLYWRWALDPRRPAELVEDVARMSSAAARLADNLPPPDRAHVRAFYSFQEGDYAAARRQYDDILRQDSTDVYAWLMLGSVEFGDRGLAAAGPQPGPRGSWNRALAAFLEAVRLQPSFELGYGAAFDIYETVTRTMDVLGGCLGFDPDGANIPPWEAPTLEDQRQFCLVALDSLTWIPLDSLAEIDRDAMHRGAERLLREATDKLVRWSLYAPDLPRPLEELAQVTLSERTRRAVAPPEVLDSLAAVASSYYSDAVALKADTVPRDLFRLANLNLGVGRFERAVALAERGVRLARASGDSAAPAFQEAANAFLATGRVARALELLGPAAFQRFVRDSLTGEFLSYGGAETHLLRVRILSGAMVGGAALHEELRSIDDIWSRPGYDERGRALLRQNITPSLVPALVLDDEALEVWGGVPGLDDPFWRALEALSTEDSLGAANRVSQALAAETALSGVVADFVRGALALRAGMPERAYARLSRIDSIPLFLDQFDARWGIPASSHLLRGDARTALGDPDGAADHYRRYLEWMSPDDSLTTLSRLHAGERIGVLDR